MDQQIHGTLHTASQDFKTTYSVVLSNRNTLCMILKPAAGLTLFNRIYLDVYYLNRIESKQIQSDITKYICYHEMAHVKNRHTLQTLPIVLPVLPAFIGFSYLYDRLSSNIWKGGLISSLFIGCYALFRYANHLERKHELEADRDAIQALIQRKEYSSVCIHIANQFVRMKKNKDDISELHFRDGVNTLYNHGVIVTTEDDEVSLIQNGQRLATYTVNVPKEVPKDRSIFQWLLTFFG